MSLHCRTRVRLSYDYGLAIMWLLQMVSAETVFRFWFNGRLPRAPYAVLLRAYYRTGQLDERDWVFALIPGEFELGTGWFGFRPTSLPTSLDLSRIIQREKLENNALFKMVKWELQYGLISMLRPQRRYLDAYIGRNRDERTLIVDLTTMFRDIITEMVKDKPWSATNPESSYARVWMAVLSPKFDAILNVVVYMSIRSRTRPSTAGIISYQVADQLKKILETAPRAIDPIGTAYYTYLQALMKSYFKTNQLYLPIAETVADHPLLAPVDPPVSLHLGVHGDTLASLQRLISAYGARAPTYPEVMERLKAYASEVAKR